MTIDIDLPPPSKDYRLQLQGITKQYPGCLANDRAHLNIRPGEVHALLGENGAGKSTLMKIIYGVTRPDAGVIYWEGEPVEIADPAAARRLGIGMVFQHFSLFETLTVAENISLSLPKEQVRDRAALSRRISEVSDKYGMALNPDRLVHTLSIGERQRVEIVRCLLQDIKLLILDEPTSVLTPQEVDQLFATLRQLSREGCSILFISHKLNEVRSLCDSATILRAGRVSGHCVPAEETNHSIARLMVGDDTPVHAEHEKTTGGEDYLIVENLSVKTDDPFGVNLESLSFTVKAGEILGVAGVAGNGQEELLAALSGETVVVDSPAAIRLLTQPVAAMTSGQRRKLGVGFVPEERLGRGAVPDMSLKENGLLTGYFQGLTKAGLISMPAVRKFAETVRARFNVKAPNTETHAKCLSGGNLQKFIIGREILQNPKLLIAAHPTWGVDVGAALAIHKALIELRDRGAAILVVSEDLDELFAISDRICALYVGKISPIKETRGTTIAEVGGWMGGDFLESSQPAPQHAVGA
ncbi:ATP-binding cassette domain-containing protein [Hahella sp. KA22]|uniref:ABC transporter ATP-binding protein n=1 Tax=Hahella sp. KA22 TaxID=1628392 RepID=UPI000FDF57E6|nr:ABC transporter ATP-binding protein [Hahella sp. KA22]AZZ94309.1 ABC transporter ATP-binding protein [Hahella sp. KA22]QAY57683.1 ATP-binding cassette domain-containing protein [Hahella sp. KA22]